MRPSLLRKAAVPRSALRPTAARGGGRAASWPGLVEWPLARRAGDDGSSGDIAPEGTLTLFVGPARLYRAHCDAHPALRLEVRTNGVVMARRLRRLAF